MLRYLLPNIHGPGVPIQEPPLLTSRISLRSLIFRLHLQEVNQIMEEDENTNLVVPTRMSR
jgi:hypothetical protein